MAAGGSTEFFRTTTVSLLAAAKKAGVPHHVALSIVGAAATNGGYYAGKKVQEDLVAASDTGWTILRATQFHEFIPQTIGRFSAAGVVMVPTMRAQPVAAAGVAAMLCKLATGEPQGLAPEIGGPQEERMAEFVRRYLTATGSRAPVVQLPLPGRMGRAMRDGTLLPRPRRAARPTRVSPNARCVTRNDGFRVTHRAFYRRAVRLAGA